MANTKFSAIVVMSDSLVTTLGPLNTYLSYAIPWAKIDSVPNITGLFSALSNSNNIYDCICVPVGHSMQNETDPFEIVQTVRILLRCRNNEKTKLLFLVDDTAKPELIRELSKVDDANIGQLPCKTFTYDHIKEHIVEMASGVYRTPQRILDLMKRGKKYIKPNTSSPYKEILLTPRQSQILRLIKERGASNKMIARTLNISESTVKLHMSAILKKYGVRNRTQLALFSSKEN